MKDEIQRYTREWTNVLPSDPGITILETLEYFERLQNQSLENIPARAEESLLKAAGFTPHKKTWANVLVRKVSRGMDKEYLHKYRKFFVGNLSFETEETTVVPPGELNSIILEKNGSYRELQELQAGNPLSVRPFGEQPGAGDRLYFLFEMPPVSQGTSLYRLYVKAEEGEASPGRNPGTKEEMPVFAKLKWECLTCQGYRDIRCYDETECFLMSGELELDFGREEPCHGKIAGREGYIVRCTLVKADYDVAPVLIEIGGPMVRLCQRDTRCAQFTFYKKKKVCIPLVFGREENYLFVYARGAGGEYREYKPGEGCCLLEKERRGQQVLAFPRKMKEIKVIYCCREVMIRRNLGVLAGYDGQELNMQGFPDLIEEELCLLVSGTTIEGRRVCRFFRPGEGQEGGFAYVYDRKKEVIRILAGGGLEGAELFIAGLAESKGAGGNIRAGNYFIDKETGNTFFNPGAGHGGRDEETMADVRVRFAADFKVPQTAVTRADYEQLACLTPGLCIRAAKAECRGNRVVIRVTPRGIRNTQEVRRIYKKQILCWLEKKRLLGVRIETEVLAGGKAEDGGEMLHH